MKNRWKFSKHSASKISYHVVWCVKYRRNVLTGSIAKRLEELLNIKGVEIDCIIESLEINPDQVRLLIKSTPVNAPHYIVQQLKRYSSKILREEFPELKTRLPTLWTRNYHIESVGCAAEIKLERFIKDQKIR